LSIGRLAREKWPLERITNSHPVKFEYLDNGGSLENAQAMAAHESPRTTKLYDRTDDQITLEEVEKIGI
jgi:hypothetical protein